MTTTDSILELDSPGQDSEKCQQILDGARKVFLEHGFDGASMNDIVKAAGVSKGTIYAYFPSKEKLFEKLVTMDKRQQVERNCSRYFEDPRPVRDVLLTVAREFPGRVVSPASLAYLRLVMAAAGKFPEIGRAFYDAGPRFGTQTMMKFLKERVERGELRIEPDELELAAQHFMELCNASIMKARMFCVEEEFPPERREKIAQAAVRVFIAAYGA